MFNALRDQKPAPQKATSGEAAKGREAEKAPKDIPRNDVEIGAVTRPERSRPSATSIPGIGATVADQVNRVSQHAASLNSDDQVPEEAIEPANRRLTVGPGILLKGTIADCDTILVEGHVEVSANARNIEISECGTFVGTAEIDLADISGHFEGELTAADKLIIRTSGRVSGKIRYNAIEIEPGGEISGDIHVTHAEPAKTESPKEDKSSEESAPENAPENTPESASKSTSDSAQSQKSKAVG